ncbi:MAG: hypothetical protein QM529_07545 [Hydrotalea sp.]|nr:hypothetical protein [Hydrotalea sp.]
MKKKYIIDRNNPSATYLKFFGRRVGKKLTTRQINLWRDLLPHYQLTLADVKDKGFWQAHNHWWLEIGFGGGENLYHWASKGASNEANKGANTQPDIGFIGAEPFQHSAVKLLAKIADAGHNQHNLLPNLKIYPDDVHHILPAMPDGCLDKIIILYPDPWPKNRHRLRRMLSPFTLPIFYRLLKPHGQIIFATDQPILLQSTMVCFQQDKKFRWCNNTPDQWSSRPDFILPSRYETKSQALAATHKKFGLTPTYLIYEKI